MNDSFGHWIKIRRKSLDLTQRDLADLVGCSASMIFKIESDERRPSRQIAELLAVHLKIPEDQHTLFLNIARQKKNITHLENLSAPPRFNPLSEHRHTQSKLPSSPTPFIGREHEIDMITKQVLDPACRMLTLTGPGGIGKTRLAIEAGKQLAAQFPDGIAFVPLAGIEQSESIVPAIADSLGLTFSGAGEPIAQLTSFLNTKKTLLVIDNLEHLVSGGPILGEILQETQDVKMILTSRESLNLQWEWLFEIQGFPIPEEMAENSKYNSAVKLFIQRARQANHDFSPDHPDLEAIIKICKLVGGSPLAIELAASWVRTLSCTEIAHELESSLDLLETSKPDVPQRHRSIKSVFDHSWELLTEEERSLMMKLSVFQGGFTRDAAFSIAGASINGLSTLVNKSLLRHNHESDRYDLHELIRQYSLAKLKTRTELLAKTASTHALYYTEWLAALEPRLKSPEQKQTARLIRSETANWIASYHWTVDNQQLEILRKMSPSLNWYLEIHGYYDDALVILKAALQKFRSLGAPQSLKNTSDKSAFAFLLNQVGWFEFRKGNVKEGSALFTESLEVAQDLTDPEVLYYIHVNWGYLSNFTGDFCEAERYVAKSLEYTGKLTPWHHAVSLSSLGIALYNQGKLDEAYQRFREGLDIWRSIGDPRGLCYCYLHMGLVTLALNELAETESIIQESNQIAASNNDRWSYAFGLDILGMVALARGQYEEALVFFEQGETHTSEIGDRFVLLYFAVHKAQAYIGLESNESAKQLLREAYQEAVLSNWILIILNALVSFLEIENELPAGQKLAVSQAVLEHPGINPEIYDRAACIRDKSLSGLIDRQAGLVEQWVKEKNAEEWAKELLS